MPKPAPDKIIISNLENLTQKYGAGGAKKVSAAVKKLIAADAGRGLLTELVDLSGAGTTTKYGFAPIGAADAGDAKRNKNAIDRIYNHGDVRPSYLMLLGSTDVIPHVPLDNPLAGDGDNEVPSDLPYACETPYSTDVQDFIAPTRVVGRLPNVTNDKDPTYLVGLINTAATYSQRPAVDYNPSLAISAHVWRKSTELSLDAIFGTHAGMKVSPPEGYKWTAAEAKPLAHFVNCHGAAGDPNYYGQKGASYPVAHSAAWMAAKINEGTILVAECCYGAELYDLTISSAAGQMGLCNTYLGSKAYAVFGSSTIAYGPATTNDQADLICQYFCTHLGAGTSAGRACLQSRLDYVLGKGGVLAPTDLKTIAQFNLMADPSLTPIESPPHTVIATARSKGTAASAAVARHERQHRRAGLVASASAVTSYRLQEPSSASGGSAAFAKMRKWAAENGITAPDLMVSFSIGTVPEQPGAKGTVAKGIVASAEVAGPGPKAIHTMLERRSPPTAIGRLNLVRGVQVIEYTDGMNARVFESR